jgi:hypothetical protein
MSPGGEGSLGKLWGCQLLRKPCKRALMSPHLAALLRTCRINWITEGALALLVGLAAGGGAFFYYEYQGKHIPEKLVAFDTEVGDNPDQGPAVVAICRVGELAAQGLEIDSVACCTALGR